jgi:signal transduction histidine kinase
MKEMPSGDGGQEPNHSQVRHDPTDPAWFIQQAALALRTRYTTVHGYTSLLERAVARHPLDPARVTHYTQVLAGEVDDLGRLLEQYEAAAQLQAGLVTLMRRPVGLGEMLDVVQEACAILPECTEQHALVIDHLDTAVGEWDPHWVVHALSAVVSNAMKFTPNGGTVQVEVRREGDDALVTVRDPGIGVQEDERVSIFLPFVRGAAAQATAPGWGLGLYIAERAVQAHGGMIELDSRPTVGTAVTIRLPLAGEPVA